MVEEIVKEKRAVIERLSTRRSLKQAILATRKAIIAEIKRKGLRDRDVWCDRDAVEIAKKMENGGACAISVLTERRFGGSLPDLRAVKQAVGIPVLRKDFIIDEFQVYESYVHGADAILLIVSLLSEERVETLADLAYGLGMEVLFEVDRKSVEKIVNLLQLQSHTHDYTLIGINNRDLSTLEVDLATFEDLAPRLRAKGEGEICLVAMSGITGKEDALRMFKAGASAVLIGTSIMRMHAAIEAKVREFCSL